jgi:hypothetical protein
MKIVRGKTFNGQRIVLDGKSFVECHFKDSNLIIEGNGLFGIALAEFLPYSATRSWHVQLGIFWIATAWLAAGLAIAPLIGGKEPRFQRLLVNVLFGALVLVVGGSLVGQVLAINGKKPEWRSLEDVINVPPKTTVRIAWYPDDRPGSWMYHCHILEHHASGMMAHFDVVR